MAKDLSISMLMDFYGQLLTQKRYDTLDLYYNQDMSLSEIAEEVGISRQGVRDNIKHGEQQLNEFEEKLGLAGRFSDVLKDIRSIEDIISNMTDTEEVRTIKNLIEHISNNI